MSTSNRFDIRPGLIRKLRASTNCEGARADSVESHGTPVFEGCPKKCVPPLGAEDIVQRTLLQVFLRVAGFEKKGPGAFRAWMRQIARNVWRGIVETTIRQKKIVVNLANSSADLKRLRSGMARVDLLRGFDDLAGEEIRKLAFESFRMRVRPQTWEAFLLRDHDRVQGKIVAERIGLGLKAVHLAVIRVREMLAEELHRIDPTWVDSRNRPKSAPEIEDESPWIKNEPNAPNRPGFTN